jgi:phage terminase Nu1 subunit (DNA packaging protein)
LTVIGTATKSPWVVSSAAKVAAFFGVARDTVRKDWVARKMPGEPGAYDLSAIAKWRETDLSRKNKRPVGDESGDPDLEGEESPGLERYRLAKAALAELELDRKRRAVIDRAVAHEGLGRIADVLRQAGERLQRQHGPDALGVLEEALASAEIEIETIFSLPDDDDSGSDQTSNA